MAEVANSKLLNTEAGILQKDACVVIVRTEWNAAIVDELEKGCQAKLREAEVKKYLCAQCARRLRNSICHQKILGIVQVQG